MRGGFDVRQWHVEQSYARVVSRAVGLCLVAPAFVFGMLGLMDMAPSSPKGVAAFAEWAGFGFWAWAIYRAIAALLDRFLADMAGEIGSLVGAGVIAYGFCLFVLMIGYADRTYKIAFTSVLQPLGWFAALLVIVSVVRRMRGARAAARW